MNNYLSKMKEVQEIAFKELQINPLSSEPIIVLNSLNNAKNNERKYLFNYYKDEESKNIYFYLLQSTTVENLLKSIFFINGVSE